MIYRVLFPNKANKIFFSIVEFSFREDLEVLAVSPVDVFGEV
jgi:hypothetical protein